MNREKRIFQISLSVMLLAGAFMLGFQTRHNGTWPYGLIRGAKSAGRSLLQYGHIVPPRLYVSAPAGSPQTNATVMDPARMVPGYFVFCGWSGELGTWAAWLYDHQGSLVHTWPIRYRDLDPDGPLNRSDEPHGMKALPDGSLVLNFDHADVMARLDPCGQAVWIRPGIFHHSIDVDADGTMWTWRGVGTPYAHHHFLVNFDPETGDTIMEIDLVEDVIRGSDRGSVILGLRPDFPFRHFEKTPQNRSAVDLFHPNDVEPLLPSMAAAFPRFAAGDLLISLRNIDLVAVIGRDDGSVKWWSGGPWVAQHDPDFRADGRISVYNNNTGRNRSEITIIDPVTGEVTNELARGPLRFYSGTMGKHQYLPGGNVLVAIPDEGRALVVTATGEPVFEFDNILPGVDGTHGKLTNALWLPPDFFDTVPGCTD